MPTNDEKFFALNLVVFIETRKRSRNKVEVYEYLHFMDSFNFLPCRLDELVQSWLDTKFFS